MNEEYYEYEFKLNIEDVHLLHHCVNERIKNWEGFPSRHPSEQEHLHYLKDELYKIILEYKFENL